VHYADVSFNTEIDTIKCSQQKQKQNKTHKIIIMIEMGDFCEGDEELIEFYGHILSLPNIQIRGIGTNLNCLRNHAYSRQTDTAESIQTIN
jgi:predicted amino acid racemase